MGLLTTTAKKAAKKLADEFDEAAWLKENPRPHPDIRHKDLNPEQRAEYNRWAQRKSHDKGNFGKEGFDEIGRPLGDPSVDGWDEAAWLKENPPPDSFHIPKKERSPEQVREVKNWVNRKSSAKHSDRVRERYEKWRGPLKGKEKPAESGWDEAAWLEQNPRPFANVPVSQMDSEQRRQYNNWANRKAYAKRPEHARSRNRNENASPEAIEKRRENAKANYQRNPGPAMAAASKRKAAKLDRTPDYSNNEAIKRVYDQAGLLSKSTGIPHEVDHVIPLQGETVSGLHVPGNLMITPKNLNRSKHASFTPGDDPMRFNDVARQNIEQANEMGLLSFLAKNGDKAGLAGLLGLLNSDDADASVAGLAKRGLKLAQDDDSENLFKLRDTTRNDEQVGYMRLDSDPYGPDSDAPLTVDMVEVDNPGQGIGTLLYDAVEEVTGRPIEPSSELTEDGARFWARRDPDDLRDKWVGGLYDWDRYGSWDNVKKALNEGNATVPMLAATAGLSGAGLLASQIKDSGMISAPRSENLFNLTMGARDLERRLEGSPASLLFPSGLVEYLETVNRRTEDPNAMTRGMALLDVLPW